MPGKSDYVRQIAIREYVEPARDSKRVIRIRQGDLKAKMVSKGFPAGNANQIGTSLETKKFWGPLGLEMLTPKNQSREADTVYEFRFRGTGGSSVSMRQGGDPLMELVGVLQDAIAEGAEVFVKNLRRDKVRSK